MPCRVYDDYIAQVRRDKRNWIMPCFWGQGRVFYFMAILRQSKTGRREVVDTDAGQRGLVIKANMEDIWTGISRKNDDTVRTNKIHRLINVVTRPQAIESPQERVFQNSNKGLPS